MSAQQGVIHLPCMHQHNVIISKLIIIIIIHYYCKFIHLSIDVKNGMKSHQTQPMCTTCLVIVNKNLYENSPKFTVFHSSDIISLKIEATSLIPLCSL